MTETSTNTVPTAEDSQADGEQTLYQRIGGRPAIGAAVDGLYVRLLADPDTARFFTGLDMLRLNGHMRLFLASALNGLPNRSGRDLAGAHAHLGITDADFDRVAGHLIAVLEQLGVPADLIGEVVAVVGSLRPVIVSRVVDEAVGAAAS